MSCLKWRWIMGLGDVNGIEVFHHAVSRHGHLPVLVKQVTELGIKHLNMTPATSMGHMNQKRQNVRSTSNEIQVTSDLEDEVVTPIGTGEKTHLVCAVVIDQGQLYTDLTGRFPMRSSKGKWYAMVVYSFDCNYIKPVTMKSKSTSEWLKAFGGIFQELRSHGLR
jgi:hypothetical protein